MKTDSKIEKRPVVAKGGGCRGGKDWELGISVGKLIYIGWINNKFILYARGTIFNIL